MSNNRIKKLVRKEISKDIKLKSHIVIGMSNEGTFIWSAKNVSNLFEALGYLDLARDEIKKKIREVPKA